MNFNSKILKISIVIALIFMLVPIVAAEDASDSVYAQPQSIDESDVILSQDEITDPVLTEENQDVLSDDDSLDDEQEENIDDESEYLDVATDEEPSADLEIYSYVEPVNLKVGDFAVFTFVVTNNGPDTATNVVAFANVYQGDVLYVSHSCDQGEYDSYTGIWKIGDLEAGESVSLMVLGRVLTNTPVVPMAYVTSDTPDPDVSNNAYVEKLNVEGSGSDSVSGEGKTLPATGNPIVMALLALLAIAGVTLGRKN